VFEILKKDLFLQLEHAIIFMSMKDLIRKYLLEYITERDLNQPKEVEEGKNLKKPRKWSASYCKKTPCTEMGFSQKASCRPYKNCYK
jgi:hypothetical protein